MLRGQALQTMVDPDVLSDANKFYTYNDFHNIIGSKKSRNEKNPYVFDISGYYEAQSKPDRNGETDGSIHKKAFNGTATIDIEKETHYYPYNFSSENDNRLALRYAGLLYNKIDATIISNTGILSGFDVIKMLLAGADAVQVVSTIYKRGINYIESMLIDMEKWMEKKNYTSIADFKGKLSKENMIDPFAYKRAQYVDILMRSEIFMQYHPKHGELPDTHEDY